MAQSQNDDSPFDVATEADKRVNQMLAETNGDICAMEYTGTIGYHVHVARGETSPEYLWKIALYQSIDDMVLDMVHVDAEDSKGARRQIERTLEDAFDPFTAESVANRFEENLRSLIDTQESIAEE